MTIIEQLKKNEKPFGLMSEEMQEKAVELGFHGNFQLYSGYGSDGGFGAIIDNPKYGYNRKLTYRLRPDYAEEPEIVECEIYVGESIRPGFGLDVYDFGIDRELSIALIPNGYKRIGFKFEDGSVMGSPVKYSVPGMTSKGYYASYEDLATNQALEHHATYVLFRRSK